MDQNELTQMEGTNKTGLSVDTEIQQSNNYDNQQQLQNDKGPQDLNSSPIDQDREDISSPSPERLPPGEREFNNTLDDGALLVAMQKTTLVGSKQVARFDRNGQPIMKNSKNMQMGKNKSQQTQENNGLSPSKKEKDKSKHKVTFIDKVEKDTPLTSVHYVLSYKKYNAMNTFDPFEVENDNNTSHCCTIF